MVNYGNNILGYVLLTQNNVLAVSLALMNLYENRYNLPIQRLISI